ncbi:MAG: glycosyltransferase [Verrucomicrobia bacterium]|nr:MAG: glycosyltransferase [Verrucomicrobiota bacterium]
MNLLHFSNADIAGGAAQATYQLHALLREAGHHSVLAVRQKFSSDPDVVPVGVRSLRTGHWSELVERARARMSGGYRVTPLPFHYFNRNLAPIPDLDAALQAMPQPDVLFLHWITHLLTVADIRRLAERVACPIIWVLLDMEPMTGGCHYPGSCTRFQTGCKNCPQLQADESRNWAERTWLEKQQLTDLPITFLAPTKWLGDRLAESEIFRKHPVARIPLPMSGRLRPLNKVMAREILGMPLDKKIILIGSHDLNDPRKGMDHLLTAAKILATRRPPDSAPSFQNKDLLFWLMGSNGRSLADALPFPSHEAGYIQHNIELALTYQSADVFACPSLEDAGPMMVSQAMLCGTPVVAFNTGIAPELITSGDNGYLARLGDAVDFAHGLEQLLADDGSAGLRAAAAAARHHDPHQIERRYEALLAHLTQRPTEPTKT